MLNKFIGMIDRKNSPAGLEITKKIKAAMRIVCEVFDLSLLKMKRFKSVVDTTVGKLLWSIVLICQFRSLSTRLHQKSHCNYVNAL